MDTYRFIPWSPALALLLALAACGGSGPAASNPATTAIGTLAYVVTDCHGDTRGAVVSQELRIRQGEHAPVTVMQIAPFRLPPAPNLNWCAAFGQAGVGNVSVYVGAFQRMAASPDGAGVVFEVTFDHSPLRLFVPNPLTPEQEGIFFVSADGSVLRRLGPASRAAATYVTGLHGTPGGVDASGLWSDAYFSFSSDGQAVAFTDRGPGPGGEDAIQIATLNLVTTTRSILTHLPAFAPPYPNPAAPSTWAAAFLDQNDAVQFFSRTNPEGLNPEGKPRRFSVKTDGTGLTLLPDPVALPGSEIDPVFSITGGSGTQSIVMNIPDSHPINPDVSFRLTQEVFVYDSKNLLQLTHFNRGDTGEGGGHALSADGQRVFFTASADPFGTNPSANCQIFSIDILGADLRQITQFRPADQSVKGCYTSPLPGGCNLGGLLQGLQTQTLFFDSNCDPLGTNPHGEQFFAMRPDGTGLRQLTDLAGVVTAADGSADVELPGPYGISTLF